MAHDTCVFCGVAEGSTRDHVPPRALFSSPRPPNSITVPSCSACNRGTSEDDKYFCDRLILWKETSGHAVADRVAESVIRSFGRPKQRAYSQSFLRNIVDIDIISPGGIYLGNAKGLKIFPDRLLNTVSKTVKGLFFHEDGEVLPGSYAGTAVPIIEGYLADPDFRKGIIGSRDRWIGTPRTTIGEVFSYWHHRDEDDPYKSLWLLLFYEKIAFLGMTPDKASLEAANAN